MFPNVAKFSSLTPQQQDEVLHSLDANAPAPRRPFRASPGAQNFFETLRQHTIAGFLIDPDYGGNDSGVGWKVIGREREHMFQAPFGFYDKDTQAGKPMPKEQTSNDGRPGPNTILPMKSILSSLGSGAAAESSPRNFPPTAFAWLF